MDPTRTLTSLAQRLGAAASLAALAAALLLLAASLAGEREARAGRVVGAVGELVRHDIGRERARPGPAARHPALRMRRQFRSCVRDARPDPTAIQSCRAMYGATRSGPARLTPQ